METCHETELIRCRSFSRSGFFPIGLLPPKHSWSGENWPRLETDDWPDQQEPLSSRDQFDWNDLGNRNEPGLGSIPFPFCLFVTSRIVYTNVFVTWRRFTFGRVFLAKNLLLKNLIKTMSKISTLNLYSDIKIHSCLFAFIQQSSKQNTIFHQLIV